MINSKQFILTKTLPTKELQDFKTLKLASGYYLYYHNKLHICANEDYSVLLLGNALSVLKEGLSPEEFIRKSTAETPEEDILKDEQHWCGRYLIITTHSIFLDTVGSLGAFYSDDCLSSSTPLICWYKDMEVKYPNIQRGKSPDFFPGMLTGYDNITRLLFSQAFDLDTFTPKSHKILPTGVMTGTTVELIEGLRNLFETSLRNMYEHFNHTKIVIALTGGRESRLVMALAEEAGIPYVTATLWHDHMSDGDKYIPRLLAKKIKCKHFYIRRRTYPETEQLREDYRKHCGGFAIDEDWNFYAHKQYQELAKDEDIIFIRSSVWEMTCTYYKPYVGAEYDIYGIYKDLKENELLNRSVQEWLEFVANDATNKDIDIWDRTYGELRIGCWTSSIEQSLDMIDHFTSIQACNCKLFLSYLFGFDYEYRFVTKKKYEEMILEHINPELKAVPYDYQTGFLPLHTSLRYAWKRLLHKK